MAKTIPLTQDKVALVDDEDYEWLNKHKWCANKRANIWYAVRSFGYINGKQKLITMHQEIIGKISGKDIDHINGDGLDNCRNNLCVCTHSQNLVNCRFHKNNTSGLRGVSWHKHIKKWQGHISKDCKEIHLGYFDDKEEAGRAVDKKAKELFGEFAVLNFPV